MRSWRSTAGAKGIAELNSMISERMPGLQVQLAIRRGRSIRTVRDVLEARPAPIAGP
jgi:hypothetical protein